MYASRPSTALARLAAARYAGGAVRPGGEALQLGQLDDVRAVEADAVLAALLRPVERRVGEADQLVAADPVRREGGDPRADRDRADVLELHPRDAVDDRVAGCESGLLAVAGQEDGELVAAETERLTALAEAARHLRQHAVARGVAEAVVDPLEVVDVDQADRHGHVLLLGLDQGLLEPLVEVAVVAEAGERVGEGEPHRLQRAEGRALVQGDREQRADERDREHGLALPEHDEDQRRRAHQRERHAHRAQRGVDRVPEGPVRARADGGRRKQDVREEERDGTGGDADDEREVARLRDHVHRDRAGERRERERGHVVGHPDARPVLQDHRDRGGNRDDEHPRRPAEQVDRGDAEHEHQRDARRVDPVQGHREALCDGRGCEEHDEADQLRRRVRLVRVRESRRADNSQAPDGHGGDNC